LGKLIKSNLGFNNELEDAEEAPRDFLASDMFSVAAWNKIILCFMTSAQS